MRPRDDIYFALLIRDGSQCYICGYGPDHEDPLQIEHCRPTALGGTDELTNLRLAHASCNQSKGIDAVSPTQQQRRKTA